MNIKQAIKFLQSRPKKEELAFLYFQDGLISDKEAEVIISQTRQKEKPEIVMYTRKI